MEKFKFDLDSYNLAKCEARRNKRIIYRDTANGRQYYCGAFTGFSDDRDAAIRYEGFLPRIRGMSGTELA